MDDPPPSISSRSSVAAAALAVCLAMALLPPLVGAGPSAASPRVPRKTLSCPPDPATAPLERQLLTFMNDARRDPRYRAETGGQAPPLQWNPEIASVARCHAQEMARASELSHASADGADPGERLRRAGIEWRSEAENVAMAPTIERIENMIMSEPPFQPNHRANVLNRRYTEAGIGVVRAHGVLWVSEDFVQPAPAPAQP